MRYLIKHELFEILLEFSKIDPFNEWQLRMEIIKEVPNSFIGSGHLFKVENGDYTIRISSVRFPEISSSPYSLKLYLNGTNISSNKKIVTNKLWIRLGIIESNITIFFNLLKPYLYNPFQKLKIL